MTSKGSPRPVTEAEKQRAVILYTQRGMGVREVAAELGRCYMTTYRMLKAARVLRPRGGFRSRGRARGATPDEKAKAVALYAQDGLTAREVAGRLGRSYSGVRNWLEEAGVSRPRGGSRHAATDPRR